MAQPTTSTVTSSCAGEVVTDINWSVSMQLAHSNAAVVKKPVALLELAVKKQETGAVKKLLLDFTPDELRQFYHELEKIQVKLDELS